MNKKGKEKQIKFYHPVFFEEVFCAGGYSCSMFVMAMAMSYRAVTILCLPTHSPTLVFFCPLFCNGPQDLEKMT